MDHRRSWIDPAVRLDDPVVWGVLPARFYRDSRRTRWTLGAADIMFTNPCVSRFLLSSLRSHAHQRGRSSRSLASVFSKFFRYGQVIETFRGGGIFQPAIDDAIQKLNCGEWVSVCETPWCAGFSHFHSHQIHLFSEGKVNQESNDLEKPNAAKLLRFKWGMCVIPSPI